MSGFLSIFRRVGPAGAAGGTSFAAAASRRRPAAAVKGRSGGIARYGGERAPALADRFRCDGEPGRDVETSGEADGYVARHLAGAVGSGACGAWRRPSPYSDTLHNGCRQAAGQGGQGLLPGRLHSAAGYAVARGGAAGEPDRLHRRIYGGVAGARAEDSPTSSASSRSASSSCKRVRTNTRGTSLPRLPSAPAARCCGSIFRRSIGSARNWWSWSPCLPSKASRRSRRRPRPCRRRRCCSKTLIPSGF